MGRGCDLWYVSFLHLLAATCLVSLSMVLCCRAAWAHLILYGEAATRQAQKEGEEAAAAYEQEKRDILAGKIIEPPPKPEKKKKAPARKTKEKKVGSETEAGGAVCGAEGESDAASKKRKAAPRESLSTEKKPRHPSKTPKTEKEAMALILGLGVGKVRGLEVDRVSRLIEAEVSLICQILAGSDDSSSF
jgi:hypothetical protein